MNSAHLRDKKRVTNLSELFADFDYEKYWCNSETNHQSKSRELDWNNVTGKEIF